MASAKAVPMVALLRGINVGTAKRIAMADLKKIVESLGYSNVRTLLNSGNIIFAAGDTPAKAAARIEKAVEEKTGIFSRVTVLTAAEVAHAVEKNPLADIAADHARLFVAVTADAALMKPIHALKKESWAPEAIATADRLFWVWSPLGTLESKILAAVNKSLKDAVTVRNLATMIKIDAICRELI